MSAESEGQARDPNEERRTHSPEFKARVAMEALKGIKPVHQIASENEIHPVQVSQWKKELQEGMSEIFERKNGRSSDAEKEQRHLELLEHLQHHRGGAAERSTDMHDHVTGDG